MLFFVAVHLQNKYNHVMSMFSGIAVLYWIVGDTVAYTIFFAILSYLSVIACKRKIFGENTYWAVLCILLLYLVFR